MVCHSYGHVFDIGNYIGTEKFVVSVFVVILAILDFGRCEVYSHDETDSRYFKGKLYMPKMYRIE